MMRWTLVAGLALMGCPEPVDSDTEESDTPDPTGCPFDEAEGPEAAESLSPGETTTGFLCPLGDQDWIAVDHSGGLLQVTLGIEGTVSPVQPTWTVWDADAETVLAGPEPGESAVTGTPLSLWHDLEAGTVLLQIRDQANDGEDTRRAWAVDLAQRAQPDPTEPNDDGVALPDSPVTGTIASRGDVDVYTVDASAQQLLRLRLQVPAGGYDPSLTVEDADGIELLSLTNPAGRREATDLAWTLAIEADTTLTLTVADDDAREHDPDTAWTLTWSLGDDPDVSEPNDHPDQATALTTAACGGAWEEIDGHDGYIATSGDIDWLSLPLDCETGLLEAELSFDEGAAPLPDGFVPSLRVVREVPGRSCTLDQDCVALDQSCNDPLDCAGFGNTCLGSGQCAGAAVCLPTGTCGANLLIEQGSDGQARLSAPLPDLDRVWLAVSEQGGDALAPDTPYAVSVRTRAEPDDFEPNHVYTAGPPTSASANRHAGRAVEIPVYDCRPAEDPDTDATDDTDLPDPRIPECCDSPERFTSGHIAHAYDQDWFRYRHPCPGEDCMVRVHLQHDAGPVDVFAQVYRGTRLWYDQLLDTRDREVQSARSIVYGGLDEGDQCFYAYNGHSGDPFWYHLAIRDTVFRGGGDPTGGTWDWSAEQAYSVCVEVIADGCYEPPCKEYTDGCGSP